MGSSQWANKRGNIMGLWEYSFGIMDVELEKERKMGELVQRMSNSIWDKLGEGVQKTIAILRLMMAPCGFWVNVTIGKNICVTVRISRNYTLLFLYIDALTYCPAKPKCLCLPCPLVTLALNNGRENTFQPFPWSLEGCLNFISEFLYIAGTEQS